MRNGKLKIAVAGLSFGSAFVPIWCKHPDVYSVDIIDANAEVLKSFLDQTKSSLPINKCWTSLEESLKDETIDAVHLVTPIPIHAEQSIKVMKMGKHCACTVPAATSLDDLFALVETQRETGMNYMMMETAVYTFQYLKAKREYQKGTFGELQLLRGNHYQDMENWPPYWNGLPPMHYATHAISPLLDITKCRAEKVHCFGSGKMRAELVQQYNNPYPAATAIFRLDGHPAALEVTRTLFETAREYCEGFFLYGTKATLEWNFYSESEHLRIQKLIKRGDGGRGFLNEIEPFAIEDNGFMLPPEIGRFTCQGNYDDTNPQNTFLAGGGHHGAHPHLVHEFARSIIENRKPAIDAVTAANWTGAGICAHLSALKDGETVQIPEFD